MAHHLPVMLNEVVSALQCRDGGVYVDGTLGLGGYAKGLLESSAPSGKVLGIDVDPDALKIAQERLSSFGNRIVFVQGSYADISAHLKRCNIGWVDGICIDIGVSSLQLDVPCRGFSFQREGPLDMRMDPTIVSTAADLLNTAPAEELANWFWEYGEERYSRRIAKAIVAHRQVEPFQTTQSLAECVKKSVPPPARYGRIHPATRVFQALRIVVNHELEHLDRFLSQAPSILNPGGRVVVVSYHSLEDRLVKQSWKRWHETKNFQIITKKPLTPSAEEVAANPRARSAKMRVLERVGG